MTALRKKVPAVAYPDLDDETRRRLMEQSALVLWANRLEARGDPRFVEAFKQIPFIVALAQPRA